MLNVYRLHNMIGTKLKCIILNYSTTMEIKRLFSCLAHDTSLMVFPIDWVYISRGYSNFQALTNNLVPSGVWSHRAVFFRNVLLDHYRWDVKIGMWGGVTKVGWSYYYFQSGVDVNLEKGGQGIKSLRLRGHVVACNVGEHLKMSLL